MTTQSIKVNRFNIGDTAYAYNINMQFPLIREVLIVGVVSNDDGVYYTSDRQMWIKEEFLHENKLCAYNTLRHQVEEEMKELSDATRMD